jgi:hypothetical protein
MVKESVAKIGDLGCAKQIEDKNSSVHNKTLQSDSSPFD